MSSPVSKYGVEKNKLTAIKAHTAELYAVNTHTQS